MTTPPLPVIDAFADALLALSRVVFRFLAWTCQSGSGPIGLKLVLIAALSGSFIALAWLSSVWTSAIHATVRSTRSVRIFSPVALLKHVCALAALSAIVAGCGGRPPLSTRIVQRIAWPGLTSTIVYEGTASDALPTTGWMLPVTRNGRTQLVIDWAPARQGLALR